ncbi:MAG: hypothetical protein V7K98_22815 [Nostoc sp.]|uniref:hypothetical protein n=1 Tax=Nostoc sp. TaxID=1180 RepID=UPI002FF44C6F
MKTQSLFSLSLILGLLVTNSVSSFARSSMPGIPVSFDKCAESKTWKRPSEAEQRKYIQNNTRYDLETRKQLGGDHWKRDVFVFAEYPGGSGTYDINNLSGLWSLPKLKLLSTRCKTYSKNLMSKRMAGIWLFSYQIKNIKWVNNHYIVLVKSTGAGIQFIQMHRQEHGTSLPLKVMTEDGIELKQLKY